jgi:quinol monooxygenase YgiN
MPEKIQFRAEFTIEKNSVDEFKKLINKMNEYVETNEPDTLEYRFYLNEDGTRCMVHESYKSSDAALSHNNSIASKTILPKIFNIAKLNRFDVYGNPNEELRDILKGLNSQTFTLFTGINRLSE